MKITEHEMLVTLATMAIKMDDLTRHDVIEALKELGYGDVVASAREPTGAPAPFTREPVRWFAERMEEKLRLNDHKGHWSNCDFPYLDRRLDDEIDELRRARSVLNYIGMINEAVDVANFAMMIADNARKKASGCGEVTERTKPPKRLPRVTATTEDPVGAWRKCRLSFTVPQDAVVVGIELDVSEGGTILSGSVLASVRPLLLANETCLVRVANGRLEQHVSLTLILSAP